MMPMQTFLAGDVQELVEKAQSLETGKLDHFLFLMSALLECYLKEEARATVITVNEVEEKTCIIPINATQEDVAGMINFMVDEFHAERQSMSAGSLN